MPEITLPAQGRCRCGALRVEVTAPPLFSAACHCTGCQRMTGSAFSLTLGIPSSGFAVLEGEAVPGGRRGALRHMHCAACHAWIWTEPPGMGFVNLRSPMLDHPPRAVPFLETCLSEAMPFARLGAPHGYDAFPAMEEMEGLLAAYAAER
ncbi:aldehyde-activating protein [Aquicoccus sp. SCR17]|nr:aldehyde-activating protein [Carideicomes alvinocaridis]